MMDNTTSKCRVLVARRRKNQGGECVNWKSVGVFSIQFGIIDCQHVP